MFGAGLARPLCASPRLPPAERACVFLCLLQVAAELGIPYEDQEYMLEPDHGQWMEDIAFDMGKDDPNFGEWWLCVKPYTAGGCVD